MSKLFVYLNILLFVPLFLAAQQHDTISLGKCLQKAEKNFSKSKQFVLNRENLKLKKDILNKNHLPTLNLNGQVSYQSDVTSVPNIPITGFYIPSISKDWYRINLDLEQLIWDGGFTSEQKKLETDNYQIANQNVRVSIYQLKQQVSILYFKILFYRENIRLINLMIDDLNVRIKEANIALKNGILLQSDLDMLVVSEKQAEQLHIQKQAELNGLLAALSERCNLNISSAQSLNVPQISLKKFPFENNRPELKLLTLQQNKLQTLTLLTSTKRKPIFKAFGQAGYGRPGYDMLNDDFQTYYMVGFRLHWNIWDWGKIKQEKKSINIQREILQTEKETFTQNLRVVYQKKLAAIYKYQKLIKNDQLIVNLQENIVKTANYKLKNGTLTTSSYLVELNKQMKALLDMGAHKIQFLFAKYQYISSIGNL